MLIYSSVRPGALKFIMKAQLCVTGFCLLVNTVQGCGDLCLAALAACLRLFAITRPNALFAK